jgi:hypothetical protein
LSFVEGGVGEMAEQGEVLAEFAVAGASVLAAIAAVIV